MYIGGRNNEFTDKENELYMHYSIFTADKINSRVLLHTILHILKGQFRDIVTFYCH